MCLQRLATESQIKKFFKFDKEKGHNVGTKDLYYNPSSGKYRFPAMHCVRESLKEGIWLKEEDYRGKRGLLSDEIEFPYCEESSYLKGFHVYLYPIISQLEIRDEARFKKERIRYSYRVRRKVYFRKVVAHGYQNKQKVIVAKEIYIVPLKKGG